MPFNVVKGRRGVAIAIATAAVSLGGAGAAQASSLRALVSGDGSSQMSATALQSAQPCSPAAEVTPFTAWGDYGSYVLSPGGSFEGGAPWLQLGGASIVADNEPWYVTGNAGDSHALELPSGSTAIGFPMCVSLNYPWLRLFARRMSDAGTLNVSVLYLGLLDHQVHSLSLSTLTATDGDWSLSDQIPLLINTISPLSAGGWTPIALQFTPSAGSDWRIDDVYVDPWSRG